MEYPQASDELMFRALDESCRALSGLIFDDFQENSVKMEDLSTPPVPTEMLKRTTVEERHGKDISTLVNLLQSYIYIWLSMHKEFSQLPEKILDDLCHLFRCTFLKKDDIVESEGQLIVVLGGEMNWNKVNKKGNKVEIECVRKMCANSFIVEPNFVDQPDFPADFEVFSRTDLEELYANRQTVLSQRLNHLGREYFFSVSSENATVLVVKQEELPISVLEVMGEFVLKASKRRYIHAIGLFKELKDSEKTKIADVGVLKSYSEGEKIISQGQFDGEFFMILSGAVIFTRRNCDDIPQEFKNRISSGTEPFEQEEEVEIGKFFAGNSFGEGGSLLGLCRRATATSTWRNDEVRLAGSPSTLIMCLSREDFLSSVNTSMKDKLKEKYFVRVLHGITTSSENAEIYSPTDLVPRLLLGKGGFSTVILASHRITGMTYAVKCLRSDAVKKLKGFERVKNEQKLLKSLHCPFIISLFAVFQSVEYVFSLYEVVLGGELTRLLLTHGPLPLYQAMFYVCQILLAVEHLHDRNIVHRDIKPENMMLTRKGYLKLTDFDTAKTLHPSNQPRYHQTSRSESVRECLRYQDGTAWSVYSSVRGKQKDELKTYTFCGTPNYCAPEIFLCLGHGRSADIWSIGVVFFQLLTGRKLFHAKTLQDTLCYIIEYCWKFPDVPDIELLWKNELKQLDFEDQAELAPLLEGLLHPYSALRPSASEARQSPFLKDFPWEELKGQKLEPPLRPQVASLYDTRNFAMASNNSIEAAKEMEILTREFYSGIQVKSD